MLYISVHNKLHSQCISVFSISLRCTGLLVAEVDIKIQLNVTVVSASNLTVLEIKRKKTCIKGHTHQSQGRKPKKVSIFVITFREGVHTGKHNTFLINLFVL